MRTAQHRPYRQTRNRHALKHSANLVRAMPARTAISPHSALDPLLQVQQAVSVEQSNREPAARHTDEFGNHAALIFNEAERGHGNSAAKGRVGEGQAPGIADQKRHISRARGRVGHRLPVDVDSDRSQTGIMGEALREIAGAAADVKEGLALPCTEHLGEQRVLDVADPSSARRLVPGIVFLGFHPCDRVRNPSQLASKQRKVSGDGSMPSEIPIFPCSSLPSRAFPIDRIPP